MKKAIRYKTFPFGGSSFDFIYFVLLENGEVKCYGPVGEIKKDFKYHPALGPMFDEEAAIFHWTEAEEELKNDTTMV